MIKNKCSLKLSFIKNKNIYFKFYTLKKKMKHIYLQTSFEESSHVYFEDSRDGTLTLIEG